jgi:hypothetical protein
MTLRDSCGHEPVLGVKHFRRNARQLEDALLDGNAERALRLLRVRRAMLHTTSGFHLVSIGLVEPAEGGA